jgi:hypothetical protein
VLEARCNRVLLGVSEGPIPGNVIGSGPEKQLRVSLNLSPQIRHFEIALNVFEPSANASNERLPAIFVDWPIHAVSDYVASDVVRRIGDYGEIRRRPPVFDADFGVVILQIEFVGIESDLLNGLKDLVRLPLL